MIELHLGKRKIDHLPFTARIYEMTVEEFETLADGQTWAERLWGVVVVRHPSTSWYYPVYNFISTLMGYFVEERQLGSMVGPGVRVRLGPEKQLIPDAFFLTTHRSHVRSSRFALDVVPKLVIEMMQPWGDDHHLEKKCQAYQFAGVNEIWLVNADQGEATISRPAANRRRGIYDDTKVTSGIIHSAVIPGFWLDVDWLWRNPLPELQTCLRQILQ
jgi:Uma2 family endonuclease